MPPKKSKAKVARKLVATQAQFAALESRLAALDKEYAAVQAAAGQLVAELLKGAAAKAKTASSTTTRTQKVQVGKKVASTKGKPGRKPGVRVGKKVAAAKGKPGPKPGTRAGTKATAAKAKPGSKPKVQVTRKSTAPRQTVESVVISLLKANKKPMAFTEIMATIQKKKLIKTKSTNFANVLRRTISTSSKIKRVARGTYRA